MNKCSLVFALLVSLAITAPGYTEPTVETAPGTLRIMTVVIVQQSGFLQYLLEPYLAKNKLTIKYSTGHHREVANAVQHKEVDIAITHTKVKAMQKLAAAGDLVNAQVIFANPRVFLGPMGDPAGITGSGNAREAMQHLQDAGYCYVINPHGNMERLQRELLSSTGSVKSCIIDNATNTKNALSVAYEKGAYTMWGLHPFLQKSDTALQAVLIPDRLLLEDLAAWVVFGSQNEVEAKKLVNYLASDTTRERMKRFRIPGYESLQPWWPPGK